MLRAHRYKPAAGSPGSGLSGQGMPWRSRMLMTGVHDQSRNGSTRRYCRVAVSLKESKMPKMKTKSGAKKRFKVTASGKIKVAQAGKRHGMIKRSRKFIRNARGTSVLSEQDARIVRKFLPYQR